MSRKPSKGVYKLDYEKARAQEGDISGRAEVIEKGSFRIANARHVILPIERLDWFSHYLEGLHTVGATKQQPGCHSRGPLVLGRGPKGDTL